MTIILIVGAVAVLLALVLVVGLCWGSAVYALNWNPDEDGFPGEENDE